MPQCKNCGSYAINPHCHGRDAGADLDLCDVCYWRKRAKPLAIFTHENSIYIAGPMTGIVDHNFPAFHAAAKALRARGYTVFNPAEINADAVDVVRPWSWYMRKDLAELVKCEAIYLLPGWEHSKGATLERHVAERLGLTVMHAAAYFANQGAQ